MKILPQSYDWDTKEWTTHGLIELSPDGKPTSYAYSDSGELVVHGIEAFDRIINYDLGRYVEPSEGELYLETLVKFGGSYGDRYVFCVETAP